MSHCSLTHTHTFAASQTQKCPSYLGDAALIKTFRTELQTRGWGGGRGERRGGGGGGGGGAAATDGHYLAKTRC